jgi:hypothetical protein
MLVPATLDCSSVALDMGNLQHQICGGTTQLVTLCIHFLFFYLFIWAHFIVLQWLLKAVFGKIETHFLLM